jgi:hypothetical protein
MTETHERPAAGEAPEVLEEMLRTFQADATMIYKRTFASGMMLPVVIIVDTRDAAARAFVEHEDLIEWPPELVASDHVVLAVGPLMFLLEDESALGPDGRRELEEMARAVGTPEVHIVIVMARGGRLCRVVPLPPTTDIL